MDPYKEFNKLLKSFIKELIVFFPNLIELKIALTMYKTAKTLSKKSPQQYFHNVIHSHSKELLSKNFGHIFTKSFDDLYIKKLIEPFKRHFDNLDEENKDMIWKHMVVLYHTSLKCEQKIDVKISIDNINNGLQNKNFGCSGKTSPERVSQQRNV